jgi:hypothetical protein
VDLPSCVVLDPSSAKSTGVKGLVVLSVVGLNYIAYAFAKDFLGYPQFGSFKYSVGYLPFAALSVAGPLLCLAAFVQRAAWLRKISSRQTG